MKKILTIVLIMLCCVFANAASVLWHIEIPGEKGYVQNMNMSFIDFFENHTIKNRAETSGIDLVAKSSSGIILSWMYIMDNPSESFEEQYTYLDKDTGSGYEYTLIGNPQMILDDLPERESVQIFAGYFDWDNIDLDIDMDQFTPFAVAEISYNDIFGTYNPGSIAPPKFMEVTTWNAVPEPVSPALGILGLVLLIKRRK
jgi:hypothetical protein